MASGGYTRRTHIVRVTAPGSGDQPYVDIEVLDAIAYQTTNGHVHVWKCPSLQADPYILDLTGDNPDWSKGGKTSTRGSHAHQVLTNPDDVTTKVFDIEVLDRIAFRDDNGKIWVLDMPSEAAQPYCVTDGTGNKNSTRRTHLEVINGSRTSSGASGGGGGGGWVGPASGQPAMVVERVDMVGFTGADEKKLIIKMESHDDGNGARANTFCTPPGYDPNLPFGGVEIPDLITSKDPNFYFKFLIEPSSPAQPIFSIPGWGWSGIIASGPNIGQTFATAPIYNSAADALAAYAIEAALPTNFIVPGSESAFFAPAVQTGTIPAGPPTTLAPVSGGISTDPSAPTVKISMGPLWWVRAVYLGGPPT
jgi:hypothetical protein